MDSRELCSIREWAPLTDVVNSIPTSIYRNLIKLDVNITCIDAVEDFIALGTDVGTVYWHNRKSLETIELIPKKQGTSPITCVKVADSVEFLVASGDSVGNINVFPIQKELPPDLDLVGPCTKRKSLGNYSIGIHKSAITCLEWSKNGITLYSGSRVGVVLLSEFSFEAVAVDSSEIIREPYEIIQLSYHRGYLLVNTLYRSFICTRSEEPKEPHRFQWLVKEVGTTNRKLLASCGGTLFKQSLACGKDKKTSLVCGRPYSSLWLADIEGNVGNNLTLNDTIKHNPDWEIPLLNPKSPMSKETLLNSPYSSSSKHEASASHLELNLPSAEVGSYFRHMYAYAGSDNLIVTHDEISLYIINLNFLCVEASAIDLRKIIDFCVCNKEIFVLEGGRSLVRLAPEPETQKKTATIFYNPSLPPPLPTCGSDPITEAEEVIELTTPLGTISPISLYREIAEPIDSTKVDQRRRYDNLNKISDLEFDDNILHHRTTTTSKSEQTKQKLHSHWYGKKDKENENEKGIVEIGHDAVLQDGKIVKRGKEDPLKCLSSTHMDASSSVKGAAKSHVDSRMQLSPQKRSTQLVPKPFSKMSMSQTLTDSFNRMTQEELRRYSSVPIQLSPQPPKQAKFFAEEDFIDVPLDRTSDEERSPSKLSSKHTSPQPAKQTSPLAAVYPKASIKNRTKLKAILPPNMEASASSTKDCEESHKDSSSRNLPICSVPPTLNMTVEEAMAEATGRVLTVASPEREPPKLVSSLAAASPTANKEIETKLKLTLPTDKKASANSAKDSEEESDSDSFVIIHKESPPRPLIEISPSVKELIRDAMNTVDCLKAGKFVYQAPPQQRQHLSPSLPTKHSTEQPIRDFIGMPMEDICHTLRDTNISERSSDQAKPGGSKTQDGSESTEIVETFLDFLLDDSSLPDLEGSESPDKSLNSNSPTSKKKKDV